MIEADFERYIASRYPDARISPLSQSNNLVLLVDSGQSRRVAKLVHDSDIPIHYLRTCNEVLHRFLPTQRIMQAGLITEGAPFDYLIAEYIEGVDLVTAASRSQLPQHQLAAFLEELRKACSYIAPLSNGFGLFRRQSSFFADHATFIREHAQKYWGRVRQYITDESTRRWLDSWVEIDPPDRISPPGAGSVVPVDANLKNYIVGVDSRLWALNVPILGCSSVAHGIAAISAHLRHSGAYRDFLSLALNAQSGTDEMAVRHYELWTLIGIASFWSRRDPQQPQSWRNWGSPTPLLEDIHDLVAGLNLTL